MTTGHIWEVFPKMLHTEIGSHCYPWLQNVQPLKSSLLLDLVHEIINVSGSREACSWKTAHRVGGKPENWHHVLFH